MNISNIIKIANSRLNLPMAKGGNEVQNMLNIMRYIASNIIDDENPLYSWNQKVTNTNAAFL